MAKKQPKDSESALELPDPYGHGFERIEDPLEKTRVQWAQLETVSYTHLTLPTILRV